MKRRSRVEQSSTLFSFFKPVTSPSSSTGSRDNQQTPSLARNGSLSHNDSISDSVSMETTIETTPTPVRKRPHPPDSDDDSDGDIGIKKTPSGRPRRKVAMTTVERQRVRNRKSRRSAAFESDDDEEEEEYKPQVEEEEEEEEIDGRGSEDDEHIVTPAKKKPKKAVNTPKTPASRMSSVIKATSSTPSPSPAAATPHIGSYTHDKLLWLKPDQIRDKSGRRPYDPDYNPRTLKVPHDFLKSSTPALKQWWKMKSDNYDVILMFKVGKFYELYHMDAVVGVRELGLTFMRGEYAHSGFPEIAFGRYSQSLVQKGYKVARVEQTETPQMMETRCKQMATPTRHDRVVKREICSIVTKGTKTLSFSEGVESESDSSFLLAIKEKAGETSSEVVYGVCFIDTSIGQFNLGQFSDDRQCSRLRTLLAHHRPAHLLYERHNLSPQTQQITRKMLGSCLQDALSPKVEFWEAGKTLKTLAEAEYFTDNHTEFEWPAVLRDMLADEDSLGLTARGNAELAISSLGACVHCLRRCLIDRDILSLKNFKNYEPVDIVKEGGERRSSQFMSQRMVLDDVTLCNLDVLDHRGQLEGSLLQRVDHCSTPFGRRLLKQWLCSPLCDPQTIHDRLDTVETLVNHTHLVGEARDKLKSLPDLQRLLRQIHGVGMRQPNSTHPDSRAIMFEESTYSKRRIVGFLSTLDGFQTASSFPSLFSSITSGKCPVLLRRLMCLERDGGMFPELSEQLAFFSKAFDHHKARKEGTIIPATGVNPAYDQAAVTIKETVTSLEDYLKRQRKRLNCQTLVYWGTGRNRYQLEIPESAVSRHSIPDEYELKSQKKGYRRYWTPELKEYLEVTMAAEDDKQTALKDTMRTIFHSFVQHFNLWETTVQCLATLDALISLATYSSLGDGEMCRPEVVASKTPFLEVKDGRHPCVSHTYSGDDFIPNDVIINSGRSLDGSLVVVVTGPNMGGKSTLMRQTGLIVILAQLGCYVPASSCKLSPVDRIFTRIGATDRITSGESTFFVELSETVTILQHATNHSLVLVDELGRGTATYDGTAIAGAVLEELAVGVACRTLFSTHYHNLVDGLHSNLKITLGHMACMVENEETGEEEEGEGGREKEECQEETITFLYKFIEGACPKSYGFNAARLAGLPAEVIRAARRKAKEFERTAEKQRLFRKLLKLAPQFPLDEVAAIQTRLKQL